MSEAFRDISPEAPELQPIISGLFAEYAARYGDYFSRDAEVELSEWYVPPQGLFIVLEREGEIIATGAYKPKDRHTAEIKRIWTHRRLGPPGGGGPGVTGRAGGGGGGRGGGRENPQG
ncbi:GNAT family N-acetyltransferase, partial [Klebsiella pneumoniae]|uniref:GNAT family N-acetyltransferase n=1 Tax=Klebsiella pneumoniae TaxID=573 RepID=UPI0030F12C33